MADFESEKQEAQRRFDALPENLKKEILADKNIQLIYAICRDYSIPEDKIKHIALLVGEVFLGYIKPEEVAHELNIYFDIDLQKSNFIEIELKQKLFNGLKTDLDKIYNPIKIEVQPEKEVSPTIIKLEPFDLAQDKKESAPISSVSAIPLQKPSEVIAEKKPEVKISPLTIGSIPTQPTPRRSGLNTEQAKPEIPATAKTISEQIPKEEAPFIIQTKVEAVKPAIPQFPKEAPSLNLRVDPSIIQKTQITKPISVRLETTQPVIEKKFQMPVASRQTVYDKQPTIPIQPQPTLRQSSGQVTAPSLKEISEQKTVPTAIEQKSFSQTLSSAPLSGIAAGEPSFAKLRTGKQSESAVPELPRTVHYSNFKTDLTNLSVPKKPEPKKEDFINLNTFTKVSGNTVDLRSNREQR